MRDEGDRCYRCTHLAIQSRPVSDLPKIVPYNVRRVSEFLVRLFGPEYAIVRKDCLCKKDGLPSKLRLHRALSLRVIGCEFADIDQSQVETYYQSVLPSQPAYWVKGKMISESRLLPVLDKIFRMDGVKHRKQIEEELKNVGIPLPKRAK